MLSATYAYRLRVTMFSENMLLFFIPTKPKMTTNKILNLMTASETGKTDLILVMCPSQVDEPSQLRSGM